MDTLSRQRRSEIMSKIRSKNTKPEIVLRKALFQRGIRYRINDKKLPGKPDIVIPKHNAVIFVHGCFWHDHVGCKRAHMPKSNVNYWESKIRTNKERDEKNKNLLLGLGWKVITIWECEINTVDRLRDSIEKIVNELNKCVVRMKIYEEIDSCIMKVAEKEIIYCPR